MSRHATATPRRRRWNRGLRVLTAAAAAAASSSLPLASEAFITTVARRRSAGPIHLSSFCPDDDVVCPSSVGGGADSTRQGMAMSATACRAETNRPPSKLRASAVVPPSSYLSSARRARMARRITGGSMLERYGGRAGGSPSLSAPSDGSSVGGGGGGCGSLGSAETTAASGTLGFVIDDADGIGRSTTQLDMSTRTYDQESSGDSVLPTTGRGGRRKDDGRVTDERRRRFEPLTAAAGSGRGSGIRTMSAATSSPLKKRIAESLAGARRSSDAKVGGDGNGRRGDAAKDRSLGVPAWFPWMPTREQIGALDASELREACRERGLAETGKKEELQAQLLDWTKEQHRRRILDRRIGLSSVKSPAATRSPLDDMIDQALRPSPSGSRRSSRRITSPPSSSSSPSVAEADLFNRRKELRRSKHTGVEDATAPSADREGKNATPSLSDSPSSSTSSHFATTTEENRAALAKAFNSPPAKYSNIEIREMYKMAKEADVNGDRALARQVLLQLHEATPNDSRVLRRLARLYVEEGNPSGAREVLQRGLRRNPNDAHLLQGLAQLELKTGDEDAARGLYKEAIRADPKFPNAYHALGTLEHSRGNIRVATTVLRHGLRMCPTNHRLHHALGDLYREARMLDQAEASYGRALRQGPGWSKSFGFTALAFLAYEKGDLVKCRQLLHEGVEVGMGMHSQGWLALATLEESEGRIEDARGAYREAVTQYERKRIRRSFVSGSGDGAGGADLSSMGSGGDVAERPDRQRTVVKPSLSGDKWIFVYKSWARMEERYGTFETANRVYQRAVKVFPRNSSLVLDWARLNVRHGRPARARSLFEAACDMAGSERADPYRLSAEFEMSLGNFDAARAVLYRGAQALSESRDGGTAQSEDAARLYHTWAVCEWHLGNLDRTEVLFDHALRLSDAGQGGAETRSLVLYSVARFLFHARREYVLAQHCVCLSLKENLLPGGGPQIWMLWAEIAKAMGNNDLMEHIKDQGESLNPEGGDSSPTEFSHLLGLRPVCGKNDETSLLPTITGPAMQQMLRKEPWHHKVVGASVASSSWYEGVPFPEVSAARALQSVDRIESER